MSNEQTTTGENKTSNSNDILESNGKVYKLTMNSGRVYEVINYDNDDYTAYLLSDPKIEIAFNPNNIECIVAYKAEF